MAVNAFTVSGKKKECSIASARSNCFWASGEQDVLKTTRPSFSEVPVRGSASAHTDAVTPNSTISAVTAVHRYLIRAPPRWWTGSGGLWRGALYRTDYPDQAAPALLCAS